MRAFARDILSAFFGGKGSGGRGTPWRGQVLVRFLVLVAVTLEFCAGRWSVPVFAGESPASPSGRGEGDGETAAESRTQRVMPSPQWTDGPRREPRGGERPRPVELWEYRSTAAKPAEKWLDLLRLPEQQPPPRRFRFQCIKEYVRRGETFAAQLEVPQLSAGARGKLAVYLVDGWGGVLAGVQQVPEAGRYLVKAETRFSESRAFRLVATRPLPGAAGLERAEQEFFSLPRRDAWEGYRVILFGGASREQLDLLRRIGVNSGAALPQEAEFARALASANMTQYLEQLASGPPRLLAPHSALAFGQLRSWYARTRDERLLHRQVPLGDGPALELTTKQAREIVAARAACGPAAYSLSDQLSLAYQADPFDYDFSAAALAEFRAWLAKTQYPSLEALNEQWGRDFADWKEVVPYSTDETKRRHYPKYAEKLDVLQQGRAGDPEKTGQGQPFLLKPGELPPPGGENFSSWSDFRTFMDYSLARAFARLADRLAADDPTARVGFTKGWPPAAFGGYDWWNLLRVVDWVAPRAGGELRELVRAGPSHLRVVGTVSAAGSAAVHQLWSGWLHGNHGMILSDTARLLPADGQLSQFARDLGPHLLEMTSGLTHLRNQGRFQSDGIAILHDHRSTQVHWMLDSAADGSQWLERASAGEPQLSTGARARRAWCLLLEDLGYQYDFVSPRDLRLPLFRQKYRVLILPALLTADGGTREAITAFLHAGGLVLADHSLGTFDRHGKRYPKDGLLDDLLGIKRASFHSFVRGGKWWGEAERDRAYTHEPERMVPFGPRSQELLIAEPGISVLEGKWYAATRGGVPACISRFHGEGERCGRSIYLNLSLEGYEQARAKPEESFEFVGMSAAEYAGKYGRPWGGEALRFLVGGFLRTFGLRPGVWIGVGERACRGVERVRYMLSGGELIAFQKDRGISPKAAGARKTGEESYSVEVELPQERYWFDPRRGKFLGKAARVRAPLYEDRATVLCALRYGINRLEVVSRVAEGGGGVLGDEAARPLLDEHGRLAFSAYLVPSRAGDKLADHVFRVEVIDPQGCFLPAHSRTVRAPEGLYRGTIRLALNEPPGRYHLVVRDVATGLGMDVAFEKTSPAEHAAVARPLALAPVYYVEPRRPGVAIVTDAGERRLRYHGRVRVVQHGRGRTTGGDAAVELLPEPWQVLVPIKTKLLEYALLEAEFAFLDYAAEAPWPQEGLPPTFRARVTVRDKGGKVLGQAQVNTRFALARRADAPAQINGVLNEELWRQITPIGDFSPPPTPGGPGPTARLAHDRRFLYLGATVPEEHLDQLSAKADEPDADLSDDDHLELVLVPEGYEPYRFQVNSAGVRAHLRGDRRGEPAAWKAAVKREPEAKRWVIEAAIPWMDLGRTGPPEAGTGWGFNLVRRRVGGLKAPAEETWQPAHCPRHPDSLGVLLFP